MAFIPLQTYVVTLGSSASSALKIDEFSSPSINKGKELQAQLLPVGCDAIYKFGDVSVSASRVVTSNKLSAGNTPVLEGSAPLNSGVKEYISALALDSADTGNLYVTIGYNEDI